MSLNEKEVCVCGTLISKGCCAPNPTYYHIVDVREAVDELKRILTRLGLEALTLSNIYACINEIFEEKKYEIRHYRTH